MGAGGSAEVLRGTRMRDITHNAAARVRVLKAHRHRDGQGIEGATVGARAKPGIGRDDFDDRRPCRPLRSLGGLLFRWENGGRQLQVGCRLDLGGREEVGGLEVGERVGKGSEWTLGLLVLSLGLDGRIGRDQPCRARQAVHFRRAHRRKVGRIVQVVKRLDSRLQAMNRENNGMVLRGVGTTGQRAKRSAATPSGLTCKFSPTPGRLTTVEIPSGFMMTGLPTPDNSRS